jgi:hypothetical protein
MGLDMYLHKKHYIGNKYRKKAKLVRVVVPEDQEGVFFPTKKINDERVSEIVEEVGYWRKANAIHNWFVQNVQKGEDDCKSYYVSREDMQKLLAVVAEVLSASELVDSEVNNGYTFDENGEKKFFVEKGKTIKDPTVAKALLPATEGFFFGSYDYDQYYYQDLVDTKKILEEALKDEGGDYEYRSSW